MDMTNTIAAVILALTSVFFSVPACTHNTPGVPPTLSDHLLDCGMDAVNQCGSQALGPVQTCLASVGDYSVARGCLGGLIGPTLCASEAVIGCLVRQRGAVAAAEAQANGANAVSARMADNARKWIAERGYLFAGPPAPGAR